MNGRSESRRPDGIRGVWSTTVSGSIGFGAASRTVDKQVLYYVEELEDGSLRVNALGKNFAPGREVGCIDKSTLLREYSPEPVLYANKVQPMIRALARSLETAEAHLERGDMYNAEHEFKNVLRRDEENIRATFGLGFVYLAMGIKDRADLVVRRLLRHDCLAEERHHGFLHRLGRALRSRGRHREAVRLYGKALKLTRDKGRMYYELAATMHERGRKGAAQRLTTLALAQEPGLAEAVELKRRLGS